MSTFRKLIFKFSYSPFSIYVIYKIQTWPFQGKRVSRGRNTSVKNPWKNVYRGQNWRNQSLNFKRSENMKAYKKTRNTDPDSFRIYTDIHVKKLLFMCPKMLNRVQTNQSFVVKIYLSDINTYMFIRYFLQRAQCINKWIVSDASQGGYICQTCPQKNSCPSCGEENSCRRRGDEGHGQKVGTFVFVELYFYLAMSKVQRENLKFIHLRLWHWHSPWHLGQMSCLAMPRLFGFVFKQSAELADQLLTLSFFCFTKVKVKNTKDIKESTNVV